MKIVCISDTHNQHHQLILPSGDMLIHAGDATLHGSIAEIQDFVDWFSRQPHPHKVFIAGNHDHGLEHSRHLITIPTQIDYLVNQTITIAGCKLWASPVSPPYRSMGFMWSDQQRQHLYQQIPHDCDVIINHSPAYGFVDQLEDGRHVGCKFLAERIQHIKPKLVICGHIHEAYGSVIKDGIHYVNASIMSRNYRPSHPPIIIEL